MLQEHAGRHKEDRLWPSMKPLALMKWCLSLFPESKSILDPFMGSGTTLVAARQAGCVAVGIEQQESGCELAAKRLQQECFTFPADNSPQLLGPSEPVQTTLLPTVQGDI
jgi:DNA modification methylase